MKIESYIIVKGQNPDQIEKQVNEFIEDAFQPFGSIVASPIEGGGIFYIQPMIKYEQ
jgi:chaperonin GroEL (HSP60 family)